MSNTVLDIAEVQGDSIVWNMTHVDTSDNAIDLTGAVVRCDVRADYDSAVVASFTPTYTDLANGLYTLTLTSTETAAIEVKGKQQNYVFDVQVTYLSGELETILRGNLKLIREVTR